VPNSTLYNGLEFVSIRLLEKQLSYAGHCILSNQPISKLLLWDRTKLVNCKCSKGASNANYSRQLLKAIERVDGLVTSDEEVRKLMLEDQVDSIAKNKEVDLLKEKIEKLGALKLEVLLLLFTII
jgi:hypothetical protein